MQPLLTIGNLLTQIIILRWHVLQQCATFIQTEMYSFRSVFLSVSAVSALVLVPNVSPIAPSTISLNNVSTIPETVHGPWNVSTVLESPLDPPNLTHSSTSSLTRQIKVKCTQILGQGPYTASCEDAVRHMAFIPSGFDESQELRWGMRDSIAAKDVGLPQEVVSCKDFTAVLGDTISF